MAKTNEYDARIEPEQESSATGATIATPSEAGAAETATASMASAEVASTETAPAEAAPAEAETTAKLHAPRLDGADIAAAANQAAAKAWDKHRARILNRIAEKEIARDIVTLAGMTEIYCADHHAAADRTPYESEATAVGMYPQHKIPRLCSECAAHLRYGEVRRALCRREPRPACKTCKSHCYTPTESAWQRRAMAYAGPRAMFRGHAIEAIRHLIHTRKS
ncbi:nitrous oxide-stimulated promoter family protein [uncultured Slackia sp.]|uniref:nitrous oxide-stimulated promoter family protein n=1 Tax=uncultured Slackia sp. TaxID=665903 RepID=UPI0025D5E51D|nr:nitrous oxide-stimulated promoter family protein [uncultured Slackia sp.]